MDHTPDTRLIIPTSTLTALQRLARRLPRQVVERALSLADRDARQQLMQQHHTDHTTPQKE